MIPQALEPSDLFLSFSFHFWPSQRADTWIFGSTKGKMIYPFELPDPGPGAAPSPSARRGVFRQPGENLFVPMGAIGRLQDPVAFVGEIDHLRRDPEPLQGGEELQALGHGNAEVEV